jgi:hypothetical protein
MKAKPRAGGPSRADALLIGALVHELAQPVASAALALDVALMRLAAQDNPEIRHHFRGVSEAISVSQNTLRQISTAVSRSFRLQPGLDMTGLLAAVLAGRRGPTEEAQSGCPPFLMMALHAVASSMQLATERCDAVAATGTRAASLKFTGTVLRPDRLALWISVLRCAGFRLQRRRSREFTTITLHLTEPQG